eukprot:scaffold23861_cov110-Isochrysis_galbana.AAC.2
MRWRAPRGRAAATGCDPRAPRRPSGRSPANRPAPPAAHAPARDSVVSIGVRGGHGWAVGVCGAKERPLPVADSRALLRRNSPADRRARCRRTSSNGRRPRSRAPGGCRAGSHLVGPSLELHKHLARVAPVGSVVEHPLDLLHDLANLIRRRTSIQLEHAPQSTQQRAGPAALALDDVVQARIGAAVHVGDLHRGHQQQLVQVDRVPAQHARDLAKEDQHSLVHAYAVDRMQGVHAGQDGQKAQLDRHRKAAHRQQQLADEVHKSDGHRLEDEP